MTFKHYEFYGKPIFTCKCGLLFPKFVIQGVIKVGDWSAILERHNSSETIIVNKPKCIGPTTGIEEQLFWKGQVAMRKAAGDM